MFLDTFAKLPTAPDILMCDGDGHGFAHPRRLGIAYHLGLLTGLPTIGVGKSRLTGHYDEPVTAKGDWAPLLDKEENERLGAVLRTRANVKPVYVSTEHRVSLRTALAVALHCAMEYRLPEPVRLADKLSKAN